MAAGDTLQGCRVVSPRINVRDLGDYQLLDGVLWAILPSGEQARIDDRWKVEKHADRTISVAAPASGEAANSIQTSGWHGYLERGVWREV